jgi:hypothetical protein
VRTTLVLRNVTLGVALSVLTAACAVFTEPVPAGTVPVNARITNNSGQEMPVSVVLPTGESLPGAILPTSSIPAFSTMELTVYLPVGGDWRLKIGDWGEILKEDIARDLQRGCRIVVEANADGSGMYGCTNQ